METLKSKTFIYDNHCPMCSWYTNAFVKSGIIETEGRVSFEEADRNMLCQLDPQRARHEIPLVDTQTGEVRYGIDALTLVISNAVPLLKPVITKNWFKELLKPVYNFVSYNRRVIAGAPHEAAGAGSYGPDFSLNWRAALIAVGYGYTALCIYVFSLLTGISVLVLYGAVTFYFLLLLALDISGNRSDEQRWDYLGHLAVLGFMEGSLFVITAGLAKLTGLTGLMFAGQGAGRLFVLWQHIKRVKANHYSHKLNYGFLTGAIAMIIVIAIFKTI